MAFDHASQLGLEGLTIGKLAEALGMSKSGVFAHFESREDLQLAVLDFATQRFVAEVLQPALSEPRGLGRLRKMVENWFGRLDGEDFRGCIFLSGSSEYDDRPGPLREALAECQRRWRDDLILCVRHAIERRQLEPETDPEQVAFEIFGLALALHHDIRLLEDGRAPQRARASLDRLLVGHGAQSLKR